MDRRRLYFLMLGAGAVMLLLAIIWPKKNQADYELSASELAQAFQENEILAMERYGGKRLLVSGFVENYNAEKGLVILKSNSEVFISCALIINELPKTINENEMITVEGVCTGMLLDVQLSKCILR